MWKISLRIFIYVVILSNLNLIYSVFCNYMFPSKDPRIILGLQTNHSEIPYQATLEIHMLSFSFHACGAIVIRNDIVLTAAHCIEQDKMNFYRVRTGTVYTKCGGQVSKIIRYLVHPKFNSTTLDYDIAILELHRPFEMNSFTSIIPLIDKEPLPGSVAQISGFGKISDRIYTNRLMHAKVKITDREECKTIYKNTRWKVKITPRMICAKGKTIEDSCQGDSGGPLTVNKKLAGLVSFGIGCGTPDIPGVYTNIAYFKNFIKNNI